MISTVFLKNLENFIPSENIFLKEPMKQHTTFRTGGEADCFIKVENGNQLSKLIPYFRKVEHPFFLLGNGSNILVSDKGYRGTILQLCGEFTEISTGGVRIRAGAGCSMAKVAREALEHGLTGLEFASGIPGTIGGGIVMNAGAYGGEMSQVVESVTVMGEDGEFLVLDNECMEFRYRGSAIKNRPYVVVEVTFLLKEGNKEEMKAYMEELSERRREKQPLEYPSAGSTFKRPEGYFAGKLIMDAGLRGRKIGGAQVSEKHCGFIVNVGDATSTDVAALMQEVQAEVEKQFQILLEPEVIFLGEF